MATEEEADKKVSELVAQLGDPSDFTFYIPGWSPVGSRQGLWWLRSQLWEGFFVAYTINDSQKRVSFKCWEYGEGEPEWEGEADAT